MYMREKTFGQNHDLLQMRLAENNEAINEQRDTNCAIYETSREMFISVR
jgi:hypothetical protein